MRGVRLAAPPQPAARLNAPSQRRAARLVVQARKLDKRSINKVVLAYSGGLDTSVILKWLQDTYDCEVVTFTADLGQVSGQPACARAPACALVGIWAPQVCALGVINDDSHPQYG